MSIIFCYNQEIQRLFGASPHRSDMNYLRFVFHSLVVAHYAFCCYYDWYYVDFPPELEGSGKDFEVGQFKYLTFWDAILQGLFFTICTLADVIAGSNKDHILRRIQNYVMVSLAYPMATFVGGTFWLLYFVNRDMVFPDILDKYFPFWLNHCLHTNIVIFVLIEFFTYHYTYPKRIVGLTPPVIFMLSYIAWALLIYFKTNWWVYPILQNLKWPGRIAFLSALVAMPVVDYLMGEKLNKVIRGHSNIDGTHGKYN